MLDLDIERKERFTEMSKEAVIVALGIGPKAAHPVFVCDVTGLGRDGAVKGCRWNFYELRRTEGLKVISQRSHASGHYYPSKTPLPRQSHLYEQILHWCCDVRGRALWVIDR